LDQTSITLESDINPKLCILVECPIRHFKNVDQTIAKVKNSFL